MALLRDNVNDLVAFLAVAKERSFTNAAAKLGISQSALSQTVRNLEQRLDVRLLNRTTRRVTPTEAGERLRQAIGPWFEAIEVELTALEQLRTEPAGSIRLTATDYAAEMILLPKLADFLPRYPQIKVEVIIDYGLTDIVAGGYDAGIRLREQVAKDMIAVRVGPDISMGVVASPGYFQGQTVPEVPQDLTEHRCINLRLPTHGGLYAWEFEKEGRELRVHVDGQATFNGTRQMLEAALKGIGLAYVPEDLARPHIEAGRLKRVLADWCPPYAGHHLYYPNHRHSERAFQLLVDALRYQG